MVASSAMTRFHYVTMRFRTYVTTPVGSFQRKGLSLLQRGSALLRLLQNALRETREVELLVRRVSKLSLHPAICRAVLE